MHILYSTSLKLHKSLANFKKFFYFFGRQSVQIGPIIFLLSGYETVMISETGLEFLQLMQMS